MRGGGYRVEVERRVLVPDIGKVRIHRVIAISSIEIDCIRPDVSENDVKDRRFASGVQTITDGRLERIHEIRFAEKGRAWIRRSDTAHVRRRGLAEPCLD